MRGVIYVQTIIEQAQRQRQQWAQFRHRLELIEEDNARWCYRRCKDKQAVVELYRDVFERMKRKRQLAC